MQTMTKFLALLSVVVSTSASLVFHEGLKTAPTGFVSKGAAPADQSITLRVALTSNNIAGLESKAISISTPGSQEFRQFLSADEVKSFVEPSDVTVAAFNAFAKANNLQTSVISPNGDWVSFTTTVGQANTLFGADFQIFSHASMAEPLTRTLSLSLPSELLGHVDTIHPATSFEDPDPRLVPLANPNPTLQKRAIPASCNSTITPACLQDIYGIPATPATEKSNTLLVTAYVEQFAQKADLTSFLKQFRTDISSATTFTLETVDNGVNTQGAADAGTEANLDTQYTIGVATGVPVTFLSNGNSNFITALLDTATFLDGVASPPSVMTTSYGTNENTITSAMATKICNGYMALGTRGISVINASGDGGVRGNHDSLSQCTSNTFIPVFPASCPFVTAVGSTIGVQPERAINFTGGGFSTIFAQPSYQATIVPKFLATIPSNFAGSFSKTGRGYPDVAVQGWNFEVVSGGVTGLVGGTSASSPSFASIISLINDKLVAAGKPVLGFLNPFIYSTASSAFTDITIGKNTGFTCPSTATAFTAATGWDPLTGFGTPVFTELLAAAMAA